MEKNEMFTVNQETKDRTVKAIEKANSQAYKSQVASHSIIADIIANLPDDEIELLAKLPKNATIKTGFSFFSIFS